MAKKKSNPEAQLLELLKNVLPKAVPDQKLVDTIYTACAKEITAKTRAESFEKFCSRAELPDLKDNSVAEIKRQFEESFGKGNVAVLPHPQKEAATVEVVLEDESFSGVIKVGANGGPAEGEEEEFKPKFVPFPVALEADPELVWSLGRGETMTPDEAAIALSKAMEDFWASKSGQQLISKKKVERCFPEFIARAPSKFLTELGLKRHYKEPEALKQLRPVAVR